MLNLPTFFQLEQLLIITGPYLNFVFWIMVTPVVRLDVTAGDSIHKSHSMAFASFYLGMCFGMSALFMRKKKNKKIYTIRLRRLLCVTGKVTLSFFFFNAVMGSTLLEPTIVHSLFWRGSRSTELNI